MSPQHPGEQAAPRADLLADLVVPLNDPSSSEFALRGAHITLDALLKATGLVASGGNAKALIAVGSVSVNGQAEVRRGRKLRPGDVVLLGSRRITIVPPAIASASAGNPPEPAT